VSSSPLLVAALGSATIALVVIGLWFPAYLRVRGLRRRLTEAMVGGGSIAQDLGGARRHGRVRRIRRESGNRWLGALEDRIERAALDLTAGEVIAAMGLLAFTGGLVGLIASGPIAAALAAFGGGALPLVWLGRRHAKRQKRFVEQLPETVSLLASTVRAGHSLLQGLEQVSKEAEEPTRSAIETVVREIGLGASQDLAMDRLAGRFPSDDMLLIVAAVNVHQEIGGSLARILDDISVTLRERVRIEGDIQALTAQQRYSAYVLALLPVFVAAALFLISRDYISALFEGGLRFAAAGAAFLVVLGFLIMRKMASIDV